MEIGNFINQYLFKMKYVIQTEPKYSCRKTLGHGGSLEHTNVMLIFTRFYFLIFQFQRSQKTELFCLELFGFILVDTVIAFSISISKIADALVTIYRSVKHVKTECSIRFIALYLAFAKSALPDFCTVKTVN